MSDHAALLEAWHAAEAQLVGSAFAALNDRIVDELLAAVPPQALVKGRHRKVWEALAKVRQAGAVADPATVADQLDREGRLDADDPVWLVDIAIQVTPGHAQHDARVVLDHARRRQIADAAHHLAGQAHDRTIDVDDMVGTAVDRLLADGLRDGRGVVHVTDVADAVMDRREHGIITRGVSTGWTDLDRLYRVVPGALTILAGLPGHGKSTWLDSLLVNLAEQHHWRTCLFSPESAPTSDHADELVTRKAGRKADLAEVSRALGWINDHFAWVDHDSHTTVSQILTAVRAEHATRPLNSFVIDPWTEVEVERERGEREDQYIRREITRVRQFARRHDLHAFVVVHPKNMEPNRNPKLDGPYPIPRAHDLHGGCHTPDTEVLTKYGWVPHDQVTRDHLVACYDPTTARTSWRHPAKVHRYDFDGELHAHRSDNFDTAVTPDHRMLVRPSWHARTGRTFERTSRYAEGWQFITAAELAPGGEYDVPLPTQPTPGDMTGLLDGYADDDLVDLLGWWISEGSSADGALTLSQTDGLLAEEMKAVTARLVPDRYARRYVPTSNDVHDRSHWKPTWQIRIGRRAAADLCDYVLRWCGHGASQKRLPSHWPAWTPGLRARLLDALLDGDGHRPAETGRSSYYTTSEQLADDVQALAISLGHIAHIARETRDSQGHADKFTVRIGDPDRTHVALRPRRHLTRVRYSGLVYCLTVPGGAYITRRNGKAVITGNSVWRKQADALVVVWRDESGESRSDTLADVVVQKVRKQPQDGQLGRVTLRFDQDTNRYGQTTRLEAA